MIILEDLNKSDISDVLEKCKAFVNEETKEVPSGYIDGIQYWVDKDAVYFSNNKDGSYAAIMFDELRDLKFEEVVDSVLYQLNHTADL